MRLRSALLCSLVLLLPAAIASARNKDVHRTVPLAANGVVAIETHNGTVSVTAWEQPNVDVSARIEPAAQSRHPEDVDRTDVKIGGDASSVTIESDYDRVPDHSSLFGTTRALPPIYYTIRVPATAHVRVKGHNASVHVTGLRNDVRVRSHNGTVVVRGLDGAADVETHNGGVEVQFARFGKESRFDTHNGAVELSLPANSRFTLRSDSHRPNAVSSQFALTGRLDEGAQRGDVNGGGPLLRFETHNGTLTLRKF